MLVGAAIVYVLGELLGLALLRALAGCAAGALLVAIVPTLGRLRPAVARSVHPERVQRGESAVAELTIGNESSHRQPAFLARDRIGTTDQEVAVRSLPPGGVARYRYELPTVDRGVLTVGPLWVERSDVLGLARARGEIGQLVELHVYPRRHPVRLVPAGRARHHHDGEHPPRPVRGSMDLRTLREYVVGDDLRHLHWKASARTGRLMVREYVDPAQPWSAVLIDTRGRTLQPAAFEHAVEVAASVLWESCEQGRPARLATTGGVVIDTAGGSAAARAVLDALCTLTQDDTDEIALDLQRLGGARGDGWFVYVGGRPPDELVVAARRFADAVLFDFAGRTDEPKPGVLTLRADSAEEALRSWNGVVAR